MDDSTTEFEMIAIFKDAIKKMDERICWRCLFGLIAKRQWQWVHSEEEFDALGGLLLDTLLSRGCNDVGELKLILMFYTQWTHYSLFKGGREVHYPTEPLEPLDPSVILREDLDLISQETLQIVLYEEDCKLAEVLIKYGVSYNAPNDLSDVFVRLWMFLKSNVLNELDDRAEAESMRDSILAELQRNEGRTEGDHQRGFRRIPLILKVLELVILEREGYPYVHNYVRCLRLCLDTLPDPVVSREEVSEFLSYLLRDKGGYEEEVNQIADTYVSLFGRQSSLPYGPRSLRQLCRCAMRKNLHKKDTLFTKSVEELQVPTKIQNLLFGALEDRS